MEGHFCDGFCFGKDRNAFAVIATGAGFYDNLITGKLVEGGFVEVLGFTQREGGCGDVVLLKELFLYAFVLDDLQNGGLWDDGFAFFFELNEGVNVDVFDFPG